MGRRGRAGGRRGRSISNAFAMATAAAALTPKLRDANAGQRLDQALAMLLPDYSRNRLKGWIESGEIRVDGAPRRPRDRVLGGEAVVLRAQVAGATGTTPQAMPLEVRYED